MSNFNFDENTINKFKNMIDNGELNNVISQIPPEMIQNFSSLVNNDSKENSKSYDNNNSNNSTSAHGNPAGNVSENTSSNFNNIDMNTILKMKSVMENINSKNDPRSNLLNSLKPYLRNSRKEKIDQYANLLNFTKIAELLKNENKEKPDV